MYCRHSLWSGFPIYWLVANNLMRLLGLDGAPPDGLVGLSSPLPLVWAVDGKLGFSICSCGSDLLPELLALLQRGTCLVALVGSVRTAGYCSRSVSSCSHGLALSRLEQCASRTVVVSSASCETGATFSRSLGSLCLLTLCQPFCLLHLFDCAEAFRSFRCCRDRSLLSSLLDGGIDSIIDGCSHRCGLCLLVRSIRSEAKDLRRFFENILCTSPLTTGSDSSVSEAGPIWHFSP
jgi:hypothetical protein